MHILLGLWVLPVWVLLLTTLLKRFSAFAVFVFGIICFSFTTSLGNTWGLLKPTQEYCILDLLYPSTWLPIFWKLPPAPACLERQPMLTGVRLLFCCYFVVRLDTLFWLQVSGKSAALSRLELLISPLLTLQQDNCLYSYFISSSCQEDVFYKCAQRSLR